MRKTLVLLGMSLALLALSSKANAQISGSVIGSVRDTSGASVPGATITQTNVNTNVTQKTESNSVGDYRFVLVPVGQYNVSAEKPGFAVTKVSNVTVVLGEATKVDFDLRVATQVTEVQVAAQVTALQTESGEIRGR